MIKSNGKHAFLYIDYGGGRRTTPLPSTHSKKLHCQIYLIINTNNQHFFGEQSGKKLFYENAKLIILKMAISAIDRSIDWLIHPNIWNKQKPIGYGKYGLNNIKFEILFKLLNRKAKWKLLTNSDNNS